MSRKMTTSETLAVIFAFGFGGILLGFSAGDWFLGTNMASRQTPSMIAEDDLLQERARRIQASYETLKKRFPEDARTVLKIPHDRAGRALFGRIVSSIAPDIPFGSSLSFMIDRNGTAWSIPGGDILGRCVISIPASYTRKSLPQGERDDTSTIAVIVAHEMVHCRAEKLLIGDAAIPEHGTQSEETFADVRGALMVAATWDGWGPEITRYQISVREAQVAEHPYDEHNTLYGLGRLFRFLTDDVFAREITKSVFDEPFGTSGVKEWLKTATPQEIDSIAAVLSFL